MAEFIFSLIVGVADLALVKFGGLLVRLASLGRWRAEPLLSRKYRHKSRAGAFSYADGTTRVVTHTGQFLIALLFWAGLGLSTYLAITWNS